MSRKIIVTGKEVWEGRASNYARYFQMFQLGQAQGEHFARLVLEALQPLPSAHINLFGALEASLYPGHDNYTFWTAFQNLQMGRFDCKEFDGSELLIRWFWSESAWAEYVTEFNALPDPVPTYHYTERNGYPELEPLSVPVCPGRPVYNPRTSPVQLLRK